MGVIDKMTEKQIDPTIVCETCDRVVRPIDKNGDEFYTCPFCQSSLEEEIDYHLRRHEIKGGE
jgi:uncharacterized CHY-type Zn-finger protein